MYVRPIHELYNYNFSVNVINALKSHWRTQNFFSCIDTPKEKNILLYLSDCKAEYTLKNGEKLYAKSGDITYTPVNSEYSVRFYDFKDEASHTVGINFFLFDADNCPFVLSDTVTILTPTDDYNYKLLFSKVDIHSEAAVTCYGKMKAGMYDILLNLSASMRLDKFKKYNLISAGILYMEESIDYDLSIAEIAALCNVSETYFRRLFKEYSGLSPVEYKITSKINKAKLFLEHDNLTVSEIAQKLNFADTAYFSKQFKDRVGMTPLEYKSYTESI